MRLALTGVPGTGKTSVAHRLAQAHADARVVDLNAFADAHGLLGAADAERHGAREVDLDALQDALDARGPPPEGVVEVWEGHFAHELDVDAVALLRCDPLVLVERLRARGWAESKVRENVEAEALDVLAAEVMDTRLPAAEVDTTTVGVDEVARAVWTIAEDGPQAFKTGAVGTARWSLESLPWF